VLISLQDVHSQFHKAQFPQRSIEAVRDPLKPNCYVVPHALLHLHLLGDLKPSGDRMSSFQSSFRHLPLAIFPIHKDSVFEGLPQYTESFEYPIHKDSVYSKGPNTHCPNTRRSQAIFWQLYFESTNKIYIYTRREEAFPLRFA